MKKDTTILKNDYVQVKLCRHGWMMYNCNDNYIGASLEYYGEWAEPELELLEQFISYGDTILDIGANIGTHTLFFAKLVSPSGCVFAYEPQRITFQMLCGNISLNALPNVVALNVAVGDKNDKIQILEIDPHYEYNFGGFNIDKFGTASGVEVPLIKIDGEKLKNCHLIKIDVEGWELKVLQGAAQVIHKHRPIIYVENNKEDHSQELIRTFLDAGYRCWWHIYPRFNPNNFYEKSKNIFKAPIESNMLCIHQSVDIQDYDLSKVFPVLPNDTPQTALERIHVI